MRINSNSVVTLDCTVTGPNGQILEQTGAWPLTYLHGRGQLLPELEQVLTGREVGERVRLSLEPDHPQGEAEENMLYAVPRTWLTELDDEPAEGMTLWSEDDWGQQQAYRVVGVEQDTVLLDAAYPWAGQAVQIEARVLAVRPATAGEVARDRVLLTVKPKG